MLNPYPYLETKPKDTIQEIVLPFNLAKNLNFLKSKLCVIPIFLEGKKVKQSFDLLVDTGAEATVLSESVANLIGVEMKEGSIYSQGVGGKSRFQQGTIENIEIVRIMEVNGQNIEGKISLGRSKVIIGKLSGKFSEYSILGILGADTIKEICLKIDYPEKYLEFSQVFSN